MCVQFAQTKIQREISVACIGLSAFFSWMNQPNAHFVSFNRNEIWRNQITQFNQTNYKLCKSVGGQNHPSTLLRWSTSNCKYDLCVAARKFQAQKYFVYLSLCRLHCLIFIFLSRFSCAHKFYSGVIVCVCVRVFCVFVWMCYFLRHYV